MYITVMTPERVPISCLLFLLERSWRLGLKDLTYNLRYNLVTWGRIERNKASGGGGMKDVHIPHQGWTEGTLQTGARLQEKLNCKTNGA